MRDSLIDYYARMADRDAYGYQTYGGDAAVAALRCFRGYHPDARWSWVEVDGRQRWMTQSMMRIHAVLSMASMRQNGDLQKLSDLAAEARVSKGYFSKVLLRFTSWGMFASISIRGRAGGLYVWARQKGDSFARYAKDAQIHIHTLAVMKAARNLRRFGEMFPPRNARVRTSTQETFIEGERDTVREGSATSTSMAGDTGSRGGEGSRFTPVPG